MSLVVVGSVAYDSIQTPLGGRDDMLGGSGTFFSIAASAFTKTSLVAVVGEDFGQDDMALLEAHNVDLAGLVMLVEAGIRLTMSLYGGQIAHAAGGRVSFAGAQAMCAADSRWSSGLFARVAKPHVQLTKR